MGDTQYRLEDIFFQAREIECPRARSEFLKEACGDDERLRAVAEKLLEAHRRAGHFLNGGPRDEEIAASDWESGIVADAGPDGWIENYQLVELIGEGTFSRVYLAKQEGPVWRCVALKIIKAGMDTREVVRRFERERDVLALMDHPGIAKILDAGSTPGGRPFFAMEWVQGVEITRYCDQQHMPVPERLALFCDVCLAVMHAHQKGVIHRDLKPSNILVSETNGQSCPKVIDFGIVKVLREVAGGTPAGTLGASPVGTPTYMSPEQARIGNPDIDTRSDIYSLGALLYELLTGHPPVDERSLLSARWEHVVTMIRAQDPLRPSVRIRRLAEAEVGSIAATRRSTAHALARLLEGDLDWIVLKALEKEREARYQSAAELVEDIRHHLSHRPVSAAAPSFTYRIRKLVRRNRNAVAAATLVAILLIASVAVSSHLAVMARSHAERAQDLQAEAELAEREAQRRLTEVYVAAGLAANDRADHDHAMLWFAHAGLAAEEDSPDRSINLLRSRNWLDWNALPVAAFRASVGLKQLQFEPRGRLLMTLAVDHDMVVWDVRHGTSLPWVREVGPVTDVAWSPDGSLIALALAEGRVEVRQVPDGELSESFSRSVPATALAFSPDGQYLAHGARRVVLWDLAGRFEAAGWPHPDVVREIVFATGSDRMATACDDGQARVFQLSPGPGHFEMLGSPQAHLPAIRLDMCENKTSYHEAFLSESCGSSLAFLDQGRVLATRSDTYEITFRGISTGEVIRSFDRICCSCNFRVSADGGTMACGMHGNVVGVWDTRTGLPRGAMLPHGGCVFDVAFSPGADLLLAGGADHNATFWSLETGVRVGPLLHHFNDVTSVVFSEDGRLVAAAQADGLVRIWKVPGPGLSRRPVGDDFGPARVRLGRQGRLVVASKEPAWHTDFLRTGVYEVASGSPAGPVLEFSGSVQDAVLSGDGKLLAVALCDPDTVSTGVLQVHDVATGGQILRSADLPSAPMSLTWHPAGARLGLVCEGGEVGVAMVEPEPRIEWLRAKSHAGDRVRFEVAYSSGGERLISLGPGGKVDIWRPAEGARSRREIPVAGEKIWSFALSKGGRYLATGSVSGAVQVWDLETCQRAGPVLPHPGWVYRVSFSADETSLVTACHDGRALVWEWGKGMLRCQPLVHAEQVLDAVFTPDDRWVLTACHDGSVRVWDPQGGEIMMPPVHVGKQALGIVVPEDGRHVVVGCLGAPIQVLSLPRGGADGGVALDAGDLRALGEVLSNGEIREGRRREFNAGEWLERFRQVQMIPGSGIQYRPQEGHDPGLGGSSTHVSSCGRSGGSATHVSSCGRSAACLDCQAWMAAADGTADSRESGR